MTLGWIWPKDPRPGNPTHWPRRWRVLDIITGRGPGIFIGRIESNAPKMEEWSGWMKKKTGRRQDDLIGGQQHCAERRRRDKSKSPSTERYDFRQRRYRVPDKSSWSGVQYCDGSSRRGGRHLIPRRFWDWRGEEYPAEYWHDVVYGAHSDQACCSCC
ncbi:hypothetical protein ASPZODRAFT_1973775 [Penicilliopsis zonata CBS 506.65]|uniref:Uncharacterized protein n=1 Tax=Penicilliopsis zonata CBS 506.65 TaxID=1073090 RepID=A0A1L9SHH3_9EURO|nr:hypothetical protein ASPZODRAFT_1973775 [Penicilliopsis zonata CBS 506.65]OJJ46571.1 hypothetical protein ASPZODRAFT_1973775 [Penicilliopsis zonata CBS 506.65]